MNYQAMDIKKGLEIFPSRHRFNQISKESGVSASIHLENNIAVVLRRFVLSAHSSRELCWEANVEK